MTTQITLVAGPEATASGWSFRGREIGECGHDHPTTGDVVLVCPACYDDDAPSGSFPLRPGDPLGSEIRAGALRCIRCPAVYPLAKHA